MRTLVDANVILRYLRDDNGEAANQAEAILSGRPFLLPEVLCEVVYVLEGVYGASRGEVRDTLREFLELVETDAREVLRESLGLYAEFPKLDFVDCILLARHRLDGDGVATFDKPLRKRL